MARKQHNELLAGVVVLGALGLALAIVVWLGAAKVFATRGQFVYFYANQADASVGLTGGSTITVNNLPVGKIVDIVISTTAAPTLYIGQLDRADLRVRADGKVQVVSGMLGGSTLAITSYGTLDQPLADNPQHAIRISGGLDQAISDLSAAATKVGDVVTRELDAGSTASVLGKAHAALDGLRKASDDVSRLAANVANETQADRQNSLMAKAHHSADDVNKLTAGLAAQTDPTTQGTLMAKLHTVADDVGSMASDARPKVAKSLTAIESVATQMDAYTKKDVAELLTSLRDVNTRVLAVASNLQVVSQQAKELVLVNRDKVDESIDNLTQVSADLKATAKEVRRNPWRLLYTPKPGEVNTQNIYDAARNFSNGAEQIDQALGKLLALSKAHPQGVPADDPELAKIRKQLQDSFGNFSKVEQALWNEVAK
jgi:ABC-type transporter Mla subunit MlaD